MLEQLTTTLGTSAEALGHHAYLLGGDGERIHEALKVLLFERWGVSKTHPPVVFEQIVDSFGIEDGRAMQALSVRKGFEERQFFIIRTHRITHQAQNALLKLFENPTAGTHFFLIVPQPELLLKTLQSRFEIHHYISEIDMVFAEQFISSSKNERRTLIEPFLKNKDHKNAYKLLEALSSLSGFPLAVRSHLMEALGYLSGPSPSLKLILEAVVESVPHRTQ
jgi:hypothetical protein